jgi:hypothetical protein
MRRPASWPFAARAQQAAKLPTIGFLGPTTPSSQSQHIAAFVLFALRVVGDARQPQRGQIGLCVVDSLDQPRSAAYLDELTLLDFH